jgi:hypothetical protein
MLVKFIFAYFDFCGCPPFIGFLVMTNIGRLGFLFAFVLDYLPFIKDGVIIGRHLCIVEKSNGASESGGLSDARG